MTEENNAPIEEAQDVVEEVIAPATEAPSPEEAQARIQEKQMADQQELQYKSEIKHFACMLLQGIKSNSSRSSNGKKDVDNVKECVRQSMLLVNYVNQLPLNFQTEQPPQQPVPLKVVNKEG
jgi:hypothetical protein